MMSRSAPTALLVIAALLSGLSQVALSRDLYRYYDGEGKMVIDYRVPAEYAGAGYEVLNDKGVVIKVVPRELTEEEKQQRNALEIQQAEAEAEQERLRKWDESLLPAHPREYSQEQQALIKAAGGKLPVPGGGPGAQRPGSGCGSLAGYRGIAAGNCGY
jgi:hypothetical protein